MFQRRDVFLIKSDELDAKAESEPEADNPVWESGISIAAAAAAARSEVQSIIGVTSWCLRRHLLTMCAQLCGFPKESK